MPGVAADVGALPGGAELHRRGGSRGSREGLASWCQWRAPKGSQQHTLRKAGRLLLLPPSSPSPCAHPSASWSASSPPPPPSPSPHHACSLALTLPLPTCLLFFLSCLPPPLPPTLHTRMCTQALTIRLLPPPIVELSVTPPPTSSCFCPAPDPGTCTMRLPPRFFCVCSCAHAAW